MNHKIISVSPVVMGVVNLNERLAWKTTFPLQLSAHFQTLAQELETVISGQYPDGRLLWKDNPGSEPASGFKLHIERQEETVNGTKRRAYVQIHRLDDAQLEVHIPIKFWARKMFQNIKFFKWLGGPDWIMGPSTECKMRVSLQLNFGSGNLNVVSSFSFQTDPSINLITKIRIRTLLGNAVEPHVAALGGQVRDKIMQVLQPKNPIGLFLQAPELQGFQLNAGVQRIDLQNVVIHEHSVDAVALLQGQMNATDPTGQTTLVSSAPERLPAKYFVPTIVLGYQRVGELFLQQMKTPQLIGMGVTFAASAVTVSGPSNTPFPSVEIKGIVKTGLRNLGGADITLTGYVKYNHNDGELFLSGVKVQASNLHAVSFVAYYFGPIYQFGISKIEAHRLSERDLIDPVIAQMQGPIKLNDTYSGNVNFTSENVRVGNVKFTGSEVRVALIVDREEPLFQVTG